MNALPSLRIGRAAAVTLLLIAGCGGPAIGSVAPVELPSAAASKVTAIASPGPSPAPASSAPASSVAPSYAPPSDTPAPTPEPTIDPGTAGPGCGTGQAGVFAHLSEVPTTLQFGRATIEFTNISVSMRNGTYDASDSVPGGIGLTPDEIEVVVGPGDHIILRAAGVTLTATGARVVPWSTVEFSGGLASSGADPVDLPWQVRNDGSLSISAPGKAGDYEVELGPGWTGACISGSGVAYGRIKVH